MSLSFFVLQRPKIKFALFRPSDSKSSGSPHRLFYITRMAFTYCLICCFVLLTLSHDHLGSLVPHRKNFPPVRTDVIAVQTTVYDMAHNKPFLNWSSRLPPLETPHKVPLVLSSQNSLTKVDRCNNSASGYNSLNGQSSSSHLSHTTGKSLGINVNCINPGDEIDKLKSQLAIAFSEVEWLETQLKVQDKGLQKTRGIGFHSKEDLNMYT
ncbi:hypothetical protein BY996DRAFT_6800059 [Phakopsora pachyrhizi]|nr:hypothetical protein BY996DRAFT_6800059 [Phakopsora pachyrhizi]